MISIIVAIAENYAIGKKGDLLCHMPADLKHFKEVTSGHTVIMGYNTYASLPNKKPLPKRRNIIISSRLNEAPEGFELASNILGAMKMVFNEEEVFIIGGASIYSQALRCAQTLLLTEFNYPREADVFFPEFDPVFFDREVLQELPDGKIYKYTYHPWKIPPRYTML